MTSRSLSECYRIVPEAVNVCSLPLAPIEPADLPSLARSFEDLGFDSVALMEFCIAIHVETGVEITTGKADELASPRAVARFLSGASA